MSDTFAKIALVLRNYHERSWFLWSTSPTESIPQTSTISLHERDLPTTTLALIALTDLANREAVNVLVWDERQPRRAEAYDNFIGQEIAVRLKATDKDIRLMSVALDDPKQGLPSENPD